MKFSYVLVTCFFILINLSFLQAQPKRALGPQTNDNYVRWLLTGQGAKPTQAQHEVFNLPGIEIEPEEVGGHRTEVEYLKRVYPAPEKWTAEDKTRALEQAKTMVEDPTPMKGRSVLSPPSQWQMRGPIGMRHQCVSNLVWSGRVTCLDYSPINGLYVGSASGGLWAPQIFTLVPISDTLPSLASGSIAVHPTHKDTIFYGTGEYITGEGGNGTGVYRTYNNGASWTKMSLWSQPSKVAKILIAPWNNNIVFVAGDQELSRSTNNGDTWSRRLYSECSDIVSTADGSVMLTYAPGLGRVFRSTNQGLDWNGIFSLPDSGRNGCGRLAISKSNSNRAYLAVTNPRSEQVFGIYRCDNVSDSVNPTVWMTITPTANYPNSTNSMSGYMYGQGQYNNAIEVHPTNPDIVWIGGGTLLKSTDGGTNWRENPAPHADIHVIKYRTSDNLLYLGCDGGVFTSVNDGATWSSALNQYLPITQFYNIDVCRTDDRVVFGASQDNATQGTSQANSTSWKVSNGADGIDVTVDWSNPNRVYTSTQPGDVFRTITGGADCTPPNYMWPLINAGKIGTPWSTYICQVPNDSNAFYFNAGMVMYYSSNKGTDWTAINSPLSGVVNHISVSSNGAYVYAVVGAPVMRVVVYAKTDIFVGFIWIPFFTTDLPGATPPRVIPSMTAANRAYTFFNAGNRADRVYRTTNNGTSWTNITGSFTSGIPVHDILEHPTNSQILWLATDQGVYKTVNGGITWWWWNTGMPNAIVVKDLEYAYATGGDYIVAGTFGRGTYQRDINAPAFSFAPLPAPISALASSFNTILGATPTPATILRSTNTGQSWQTITTSSGSVFGAVYMIDSLTCMAVGTSGAIISSTDGGLTWFTKSSSNTKNLHDVCFINKFQGFAVGDVGTILSTWDSGEHWYQTVQGLPGSIRAIAAASGMIVVAGGIDSTFVNPRTLIRRTTDGGQSWNTVQNVPNVGMILDITFTSKGKGFCTTEQGVILKTTNSGSTWFMQQMATNRVNSVAPLNSISFADEQNGWACGSGGVLLNTKDGGTTWNTEETESTENLSSLIIANSTLLTAGETGVFSRAVEQTLHLQYTFNPRWNMVSVPVSVSNDLKESVFPDAVSEAFSFEGQYISQSTLKNGVGYWMKFTDTTTMTIDGYVLNKQVIDVKKGWNMIGTLSATLPLELVESIPEQIVESDYYGYDHGYKTTTVLEPAKAYWVKVNQDGQLVLNGEGPFFADTTTYVTPDSINDPLVAFNTITLTDKAGKTQTLYFSTMKEPDQLLKKYDLPPSPPEGSFDVRFGTDKSFECASAQGMKIIPINLSTQNYPVTIEWEIHQMNADAKLKVNGKFVALNEHTTTVIQNGDETVALVLQKGMDISLPQAFTLEQNYPNPFNPVTTIKYAIPDGGATDGGTRHAVSVQLKIYNMLGQEVATLVDEVQDAGFKSVQWDASSVPTGVYFYKLSAGPSSGSGQVFTDVKKMLLVR